jgi:hypothetical protein
MEYEAMNAQKELGPLGLLRPHCETLPSDTLKKLQVLAELDLTPEKWSLFRHQPEQYLLIDVIERELKRFLSLPVLIPEPDYSLAPPLLVDELWHELIINTPKYRSMCDALYGAYLDHSPNPHGHAKELARTAGEIAEYTRSLIAKHYGGLVQAIWATDIMRPCQPDVVKCTWPPPKLDVDVDQLGLSTRI